MRKYIISGIITATIIAVAGVVFYACKKDNDNATADKQITNDNNAVRKQPLWDEFEMQTDNGLARYNRNTAPFWPFNKCPIKYYVYNYDNNHNLIGINSFWWPCVGNIKEIPPVNADGIFIVHEAVLLMHDLEVEDRLLFFIAFEQEHSGGYDWNLSDVFDAALIEAVISGQYAISSITESQEVSTTGGKKYTYEVVFSNPNDVADKAVEIVSFSYNWEE